MTDISTLFISVIAAVFLPIFPLSMVFNALFDRVHQPWARVILLLLWPNIGIALLTAVEATVPDWFISAAIATSLLYAFRALSLHDVGLWIGYLATSLWALIWVLLQLNAGSNELYVHALGMTVPLILLSVLAAGLTRRYGAAYIGLYGGLASSLPRYSSIMVIVILAIIATPLFPSFFTVASLVMETSVIALGDALAISLLWLIWTWAGARLIHGLVVGSDRVQQVLPMQGDLSLLATWIYAVLLITMAFAGVYFVGITL